jgi:hypothetical protein
MSTEEKTCFVISPIGDEESDTRKEADDLLNGLIKPEVDKLGYKVNRGDNIKETGSITSQVIRETINAKIVIAVLNKQNPNVFYELAIRHFVRKPLILLAKYDEKIPFDIFQERVVKYNPSELTSINSAREDIRKFIEQFESDSNENIVTPISAAIEVTKYMTSDDPNLSILGEILQRLDILSSKMAIILDGAKRQNNLDGVTDILPKPLESKLLTELNNRIKENIRKELSDDEIELTATNLPEYLMDQEVARERAKEILIEKYLAKTKSS